MLHHWRLETKPSRTADEYAAFLFPLLDHASLKKSGWEGIAICSVVPPVSDVFETFCKDYLKRSPFKVTCNSNLGFKLNVEVPSEVGADRLANSAYAIRNLQLPAIVVDLGTATTFDVILIEKSYEGGIILPGVQMGAESLSRKTSLLPMVDVAFPKSVIGKNTVTCIQSGVLYGYCDAIEGLLKRLQKEIGQPCDIALTGGVSPLIAKNLSLSVKLLPNLTLEGIEILYRQNA